MELPIAHDSYRPSAAALVRAVRRADHVLARTAAQETDLDGATALTCPDRPGVHMLNRAIEMDLEVAAAADAGDRSNEAAANVLLARIDAHFTEAGCPCHEYQSAGTEWSAPLVAALTGRGTTPRHTAVHLLQSYCAPAHPLGTLQIIPGRAAFSEVEALYRQLVIERWEVDGTLAGDLAQTLLDFLDEPRLEVFLGRLEHRPVGLLGLVTLGQIGVIREVYTHPDHRCQGVASALLAHAMDHCQRALFEQVVLETDEAGPDRDAARRLYASIGFTQIATTDQYVAGAAT